MKNARIILAATILMLVAILVPRTANALPKSWNDSRTKTIAGVTYRYRKSDHAAVVIRTRGKSVTIPREVRIGRRFYEVKNIWQGGINRKCRRITIHADLESCEDGRLWQVKVYVTNRGVYHWLHDTGANVRYIR